MPPWHTTEALALIVSARTVKREKDELDEQRKSAQGDPGSNVMTGPELAHFLDDYRRAVESGSDETPEWGVLITVMMEHCETSEQHDALIAGIDKILLSHFRILPHR
jgi:hypothetical protein